MYTTKEKILLNFALSYLISNIDDEVVSEHLQQVLGHGWHDFLLSTFKGFDVMMMGNNSSTALLEACKQAVCGNMGWKGKLKAAIASAEGRE